MLELVLFSRDAQRSVELEQGSTCKSTLRCASRLMGNGTRRPMNATKLLTIALLLCATTLFAQDPASDTEAGPSAAPPVAAPSEAPAAPVEPAKSKTPDIDFFQLLIS